MNTIFRGATVISPFTMYERDVLVADDRICAIAPHIPDIENAQTVDAGGMYLTPGFIDLHVHGGGGCSASSGIVEDVVTMANAHSQFGTTTIVPTLYTMPWAQMLRGAEAICKAMTRWDVTGTIAGFHMEGPFLSPQQAGAQVPGALAAPEDVNLSELEPYLPHMRMVGMAPEVPGTLALAEKLAQRGIVVSAAHTNASYPQVETAVEHGFSDVTHIYSTCSTVRREKGFRVAGVVEAGLEMEELTVQAIADGCHLPDALLRLIYRCKGPEKMYLITDGLEYSAAQVKEGSVYTQANGIRVVCEDGVLKLMNREAFAGSIATADRLLRTVYHAGIPLCDSVRMLTATPAERIGLKNKGRIQEGYDADLVLLDRELQVRAVMAGGRMLRCETEEL